MGNVRPKVAALPVHRADVFTPVRRMRNVGLGKYAYAQGSMGPVLVVSPRHADRIAIVKVVIAQFNSSMAALVEL